MKLGGKGGANTLTGLHFEKRTDLKQKFDQLKGYSVKNSELLFKEEHVATFFRKNDLYKKLLEVKNVEWKKLISKRLLPDDALHVIASNTMFIIELKFQQTSGSVDEKLQTCDFKLRQYKKLCAPLGMRVRYLYVLNGWFQKPEYRDVLNYIQSVGCEYYFEELDLKTLGLPSN